MVFNRELVTSVLRMPLVLVGLARGGLLEAVVRRGVDLFIDMFLGVTLARYPITLPLRPRLVASWRTIVASLAVSA